MNALVKLSLILIAIGSLSLWSVWTSTNRWISLIFGMGGILLIIAGIFVLQAWAAQREKKRLSEAFDPSFKYNQKRHALLCNLSYVGTFLIFIAILFTYQMFFTLGSKWMFAMLFGRTRDSSELSITLRLFGSKSTRVSSAN